MTAPDALRRDLDEIWPVTEPLWADLKDARLLVTGGTGFVGSWLLEALCHADRRLGLAVRAVVLSRHPENFRRKAPHLAESGSVDVVPGDVRALPDLPGEYSHVIHAATDASAQLVRADPLLMLDTILAGTRNVLGWAGTQASRPRTLFVSSGAIYGPQPPDLPGFPEDYAGAPECASAGSVYGEGKRAAETLCSVFHRQAGLPVTIARLFAFVGPYLPLDTHYAVGNFIRDAMRGGPIVVRGDGSTVRSYLYASDMTAWLWHLLLRGTPGVPVNVGSENAITTGDLAALVGRLLKVGHRIEGAPLPGAPPDRYVPSTARARGMGLEQRVDLEEGILRTSRWHGASRG